MSAYKELTLDDAFMEREALMKKTMVVMSQDLRSHTRLGLSSRRRTLPEPVYRSHWPDISTPTKLTHFERVAVLTHRTKEIDHGAPILVSIDGRDTNADASDRIAKQELIERKLDFYQVKRWVGGEYRWVSLRMLEI